MTPAQHLALIDAVIEKRLRGDAYESYWENQQRFFGTPLERLYEIRSQLQQEVTSSAGGFFQLAQPFDV